MTQPLAAGQTLPKPKVPVYLYIGDWWVPTSTGRQKSLEREGEL